jgi:hypothetical protein
MKYLGIDYGSASHRGVDDSGMIAFPHATVKYRINAF